MSIFAPLQYAIVQQLLAAQKADAFSRPAVIEGPLDGLREDEELQQLRVDVLIGDKQCEPLDRARQRNTVRMDVVVRQIIKPQRKSEMESREVHGLMAYVEELDEYLSDHDNRRPPDAQWAAWQNSETIVAYSPPLLRADRLFYSLFRLNYFVATSLTNPDVS